MALAYSRGDTKAYQQFLTAIKEAVKKYYNFEWYPNFVVYDAADSITNPVAEVFPQTELIRCYFHTVKSIRKKTQRWKDKSEKEILKASWGYINHAIKLLHMHTEDTDFTELWELVAQDSKSKKIPLEFIEYVKKNFIDNRNKVRWNCMNKLGINLTNNGLERLHKDITKHTKLKLNQFLFKATKFIKDYSLEHRDEFTSELEIPIPIWRKGLLMLNQKIRYKVQFGIIH